MRSDPVGKAAAAYAHMAFPGPVQRLHATHDSGSGIPPHAQRL